MSTPGTPPARDDVLAALRRPGTFGLYDGAFVDALPREDHVLVLVRDPRAGGVVGVAFDWPDAELEGPSTGEPQEDLDSWVIEVSLVLEEGFATQPVHRLRWSHDELSGHRVVAFGPYLSPTFAARWIRALGFGPAEVSWDPEDHAPVGLRRVPGGWSVHSPERPSETFDDEGYAWGELGSRVLSLWPERVLAARDDVEGFFTELLDDE